MDISTPLEVHRRTQLRAAAASCGVDRTALEPVLTEFAGQVGRGMHLAAPLSADRLRVSVGVGWSGADQALALLRDVYRVPAERRDWFEACLFRFSARGVGVDVDAHADGRLPTVGLSFAAPSDPAEIRYALRDAGLPSTAIEEWEELGRCLLVREVGAVSLRLAGGGARPTFEVTWPCWFRRAALSDRVSQLDCALRALGTPPAHRELARSVYWGLATRAVASTPFTAILDADGLVGVHVAFSDVPRFVPSSLLRQLGAGPRVQGRIASLLGAVDSPRRTIDRLRYAVGSAEQSAFELVLYAADTPTIELARAC